MNVPPAVPPAPAPQPAYTPPPSTSGLAITSVIVGLLGFCLPVAGSLLAAVLGLVAIFSIKGSGGQKTGTGLAVFGMILGILGVLLYVAFFVGVAYVGTQIVKAAKEFEGQMKAVSAAAEKGDWEGVAKELTGPDSPSKDEITQKFRDAETKYGKIAKFDLAQSNLNEEEFKKDMWSIPMKLVFNIEGEKGEGHLIVETRRRGGKLQVTGLEFKDGHVVKTIDRHGKDWDD